MKTFLREEAAGMVACMEGRTELGMRMRPRTNENEKTKSIHTFRNKIKAYNKKFSKIF